MTPRTDTTTAAGQQLTPALLVGAPVVVGFDEGRASVTAVRWAAVEAARLGSRLTVLSAMDPLLQSALGAGVVSRVPDLWSLSRATAARGADVARASSPDVAVGAVGVVGGPAGELVARSSGAGLVVVGRSRRTALQAAVLGSVSFAVAAHARCPVVVVGDQPVRHPGAQWPVVVGTDGSRPALAAVSLAAEFASRWQAPLRVVGAWGPPPLAVWADSPGEGSAPSSSDQPWAAAAQAAVDEGVTHARAVDAELAVDGEVTEGRADDVLVEVSRRAGLVVMGSRGHGGFAGLMMGSVSHAVMRRAGSPVVVVRRGPV